MPKVTIYAPNGKVSVREIPAGALLLHALGGGVETPAVATAAAASAG